MISGMLDLIARLTYVRDPFLDSSHQVFKMCMQSLEAARIQENSALATLTAGGTSSARAGIRASALAPTTTSLCLCSVTLSNDLLLLAEELDLRSSEAQVSIGNGLREGHGRRAQMPARTRPMST